MTLNGWFYAIGTVGLLLFAMLMVIVQPYNKKFATYNTTDTVLILLLAAWYASVVCLVVSPVKFSEMSVIFTLLTSILPLFYIIVIIIHWLYTAIHVKRCK